jgi:ABC-type sugar transport system substrate-binding protein
MNKRLSMVLVFGLIVVLGAFCGGGRQQRDGKRPLRFILSNAYYTAPYCAAYNPSAEATAKSLGVELTILDGNGNQQTQLEHANLAIAQGYDGFLYFPADVGGALPVIEALNDSAIAWVGVNAYPGDDIAKVGMKYYVGPDAASHGHTMTSIVKEKFPKGARIVVIEGTAGHMQTIQLNRAFAEDLGSEYVFLDRQDCNFQAEVAMTKTTDMLTAYGISSKGGRIDCIVSHDGGMLTGVISALESQGIKPGDVTIIAMGSNKVLYNAMEAGWLSACSTQDPVAEAKLAVETLYGVIQGTATSGWTKLPTPVAYPETKDNFNWF